MQLHLHVCASLSLALALCLSLSLPLFLMDLQALVAYYSCTAGVSESREPLDRTFGTLATFGKHGRKYFVVQLVKSATQKLPARFFLVAAIC